ncbi:PRC-barrel domain-containing protein [Roseobacter sp. HKCCA0434]|uniref:PRC-barrel domain-containing protein n=1 Tax=Roseobacter sp. HKCCA0434 TaxID=3079297 RepID=UPI0029058D2F|nr:PRC-barrel domain-containing protein [Roseobacter sp. HKCCA0434]
MFVKLHDLTTLSTTTPDGDKAKVAGVYLDGSYAVQKVAANLDGLLNLGLVALPVSAFGQPDFDAGTWPVEMDRAALGAAERIEHKPGSAVEAVKELVATTIPERLGDLRAGSTFKNLELDLNDGPAGRVLDIVIDTTTMRVAFLVVETGSFLPERQVLMPIDKLASVNWETPKGHLDCTQEQVSSAPDVFDEDILTTKGSGTLLNYYGLSS